MELIVNGGNYQNITTLFFLKKTIDKLYLYCYYIINKT